MTNGYTFEREGDGYRFITDQAQAGGSGARQPPLKNLLLVAAVVVFIGSWLTQAGVSFFIGLMFTGGLLYAAYRLGPPKPAEPERRPGVLVTPTMIVAPDGVSIPVGRINSINIKNEMDAAAQSFAGNRTRYRAGSGMAVADAIGHDARLARAKTRYLITVQHGPADTMIAKRLNESGANGLRADIQRVLGGQSLD